ncbi:hypothetical protein [Kytococcus sedentarius]|uniref:hypothetical protein n=1 Tax=Kytococcus sedentarius TaxID=1276 RepID=UPI0035BC3050
MGEQPTTGSTGTKVSKYQTAEVWSTTVQGHRIEGRFAGGWPEKTVWLDVDGTTVGRASNDTTVRVTASTGALTNAGWSGAERGPLGFGGGVELEVRHAQGKPYDMDLLPEGTTARGRRIALEPPAGSAGERFQQLRERRPRVAALRHLLLRLGFLLVPLLILLVEPVLALLRRLLDALGVTLPRIPWPDLPSLPRIPWPDLPSLPRIPWPDLPDLPDLPSLPRIPWPDLSWLFDPIRPLIEFLQDNGRLIGALVVGLALAATEVRRQRARRETRDAERQVELERLARAMRQVADRGESGD